MFSIIRAHTRSVTHVTQYAREMTIRMWIRPYSDIPQQFVGSRHVTVSCIDKNTTWIRATRHILEYISDQVSLQIHHFV